MNAFHSRNSKNINIRVNANTNAANRALRETESVINHVQRASRDLARATEFLKFPILAVQATAFGYALAGVASQAYALTSALAPALGIVATAPNLLSAAAQAAGTTSLAFMGLEDAIKAMDNVSNRSAEDAVRAAEAQESAARQVRNAEAALANAQGDAQRAQEDLTLARKEAGREISAMRSDLYDLGLAEERAALSVEQARERLNEVNADASASDLDRRDAALDLREAEQRLDKTIRDRGYATLDLQAAEQAGVDGHPKVVAANENIRAANERVALANQALADAYTTTAAVGSAAMEKLETATADLSPATLAFAEKIHGLKDEMNLLRAAAGENMFPGLTDGLDSLLTMLPLAEQIVGNTARAIGDLAREGGALVASPPWTADFAMLAEANVGYITQMGHATFDLFDALRNVMVAATPLTQWLVDTVERWAEYIAQAAQAGRETGAMAGFFERTRDVLEQLFDIVGNVAIGLYNIGVASSAMGGQILTDIDNATARFAEWSGTMEGQTAIKQWFDDVAAASDAVWESMDRLFTGFGTYVLPIIETYILPNLDKIAAGYIAIHTAMGLVNFFAWASSMTSAMAGILANPAMAGIALGVTAIATAFTVAYQESDAFRSMVDQVTAKAPGLIDAFNENGAAGAVTYLAESYRELYPMIKVTMDEMFVQFRSWIQERTPELATEMGAWSGEMVAWIMNSLPGALESLGTWLSRIGEWLINEGLPMVWEWLTNFTRAFFEWVGPALPDLLRELGDLLLRLLDWIIVDALPFIITKLGEWGLAFISWVVPRIPELLTNLQIFLNSILDWVAFTAIPAVAGSFLELGQVMLDSLASGWHSFNLAQYLGEDMTAALNVVIDVINAFTESLKALASMVGINLDITPMDQLSPVTGSGGRSRTAVAPKRSGFAEGGWTGPGSTWDPAGIVHADEFVMSKRSRRALESQAPGALDYMNRTGRFPGYAVGGDVEGLNATFMATLQKWSAAVGQNLHIVSGYRSRAEQERLYAAYLNGTGNLAAKPGTSRHESGLAADVAGIFRRGYAGGNMAAQFGLHFPVKSENWHVEPLDLAAAGDVLYTFYSDLVRDFVQDSVDPARALLAALPDTASGRLGEGMGNRYIDRAVDWITAKAGAADQAAGISGTGTGAYLSTGSGVERWRQTVLQALGVMGLPASLADTTLRRMNQESGGDPNAVNRYDINWQRGYPSVGLMQVIRGTYGAYKHPAYNRPPFEYGVSKDPMSNILASMRYALDRYGSLPAAYNRKGGYDSGGILRPGWTMAYNGTGENETIRTAAQERELQGNKNITIRVDARSDPRAVPIARAVAWRMKTSGV